MPEREPRQTPISDEIDRELEKLRGFGSTLLLALGTSVALIVLVTALLWWMLF